MKEAIVEATVCSVGSSPELDRNSRSVRRSLYPKIYENDASLQRDLDRSAVEIVAQSQHSGFNDVPVHEESNNISGQTDIWGRYPAKEPARLLECTVCCQKVNGLRFASHLDKCLGINTLTRNVNILTRK